MNSISWFIYLAGLFENLRDAAQGILIIGGVFGGGIILAMFAIGYAEEEEGLKNAARRALKWFAPTMLVAVLLAILVPAKNTMYAIAASEVGERIVKSEKTQEIASDATKALHQWIKKQIEPAASK